MSEPHGNSRVQSVMCSAEGGTLSPFKFDPYRNKLIELLQNYRENPPAYSTQVAAALDGQPGRELRRRYKVDLLRSTGTFFTGSELASRLTANLNFDVGRMNVIVDPACGAGDLLVACAKRLPIHSTLASTTVVADVTDAEQLQKTHRGVPQKIV